MTVFPFYMFWKKATIYNCRNWYLLIIDLRNYQYSFTHPILVTSISKNKRTRSIIGCFCGLKFPRYPRSDFKCLMKTTVNSEIEAENQNKNVFSEFAKFFDFCKILRIAFIENGFRYSWNLIFVIFSIKTKFSANYKRLINLAEFTYLHKALFWIGFTRSDYCGSF